MPVIRTCSFLLHSGRKCQAPARDGSPFCRHHDPSGPPRKNRRIPSTAPEPENPESTDPDLFQPTRAQVSAYWRTYPNWVAHADASDIQQAIEAMLEALSERAICHRSAGRIFAAIADRRVQLAKEAEEAAFQQFMDQAARFNPTALGPEFEDLRDLTPTQLHKALSPQTKNAPN
jgi:hypothetical protein